MHPEERVRIVVETARAVLDERVDPAEAEQSIRLQAVQITPMLRSDRIGVTTSECEVVSTRLRLLAEQVNDHASGLPDPDTMRSHLVIAEVIGGMAQALR